MSRTKAGYPTIPEYYKRFVDESIDLTSTTLIPCKFHDEKDGKSFSYMPRKDIFMCFGKCHCGGNVIRLHRLNYKLATDEEAEESLDRLYGVEKTISFEKEEIHVDQRDIAYRSAYANALRAAKTIDDYVELDYIMSQYPPDTEKLVMYTNVRRKV